MDAEPTLVTAPVEPFVAMLRGAALPAVVAVPVITGIAWVWRGEQGALSSLVGALVALVLFGFGLVAIKVVLDGHPAFSLAGAMVVYIGQLIGVLFVIVLLRRASWLDGRAFAAGVIAEGLVWQIGQVTGFLRGRHEIYHYPSVETPDGDPGDPGDSGDSGGPVDRDVPDLPPEYVRSSRPPHRSLPDA